MPKLTIDFSETINVLVRDDGTKEKLLAIAWLRGEGGSYAGPVRDALARYVAGFVEGLSAADRKRFDEILVTVKQNAATQRAIRSDGGGRRVKRRHSLTA